VLALLSVALFSVEGCEDQSPVPAAFSGEYGLTSVDGQALPATVVTGFFGGATMNVQHGRLAFEGNTFILEIVGPVNGTGSPVTLATGGTYTAGGANVLQSSYGVNGRVWVDSADVTTQGQALVGAHRYRFTRAP
jgi:hypothetical protein